MTVTNEGFEYLNFLGIKSEVQQLFSPMLEEDENGRLVAEYRDGNGNLVDRETLGITIKKLPSFGILHFSPAPPENVRALYLSEGVLPLVMMVQCTYHRRDFLYAAFMATGAKMEKSLIRETIDIYPKGIKTHTVFDHSLLGRIRDCKVQYWIKGMDCLFWVEGSKVLACFQGKEFWMSVGEFSLRNHLRQVGVRQTVSTIKPVIKDADKFNGLW